MSLLMISFLLIALRLVFYALMPLYETFKVKQFNFHSSGDVEHADDGMFRLCIYL